MRASIQRQTGGKGFRRCTRRRTARRTVPTWLISVCCFLFCLGHAWAQPIHILGRNANDQFTSPFWTRNNNASNAVEGINANTPAGTTWRDALLPTLIQSKSLGGTFRLTNSFEWRSWDATLGAEQLWNMTLANNVPSTTNTISRVGFPETLRYKTLNDSKFQLSGSDLTGILRANGSSSASAVLGKTGTNTFFWEDNWLTVVEGVVTASSSATNFLRRPFSTVKTLAELLTLAPGTTTNIVMVLNRVSLGDGFAGQFYPTNTVTGTNLGTRIYSGVAGWSWERIFSGPYQVKWFGAKGDGVTDDYVAITNAIETVEANGGLFFHKGRYLSSGQLVVNEDNSHFFGEGSASELLFAIGLGSTPHVLFEKSGDFMVGFSLRDLKITAQATNAVIVKTIDAREFHIRNVYLSGPSGAGNTGTGVLIVGSGGGLFSAFGHFHMNYVDGVKFGGRTDGAVTYLTVTHNTFEGIQNPGIITGSLGFEFGTGGAGGGGLVSQNSIEGYEWGVDIVDGTYMRVMDNRFENVTKTWRNQAAARNNMFVGNADVSGVGYSNLATTGEDIIIQVPGDEAYGGKQNWNFNNIVRQGVDSGRFKQERRRIEIGGSAPQWIKIGSVSITAQNHGVELWGTVITKRNSDGGQRWRRIRMKASQTLALGNAPVGELNWEANTSDDIKAVATTVSGTESVITLYVYDSANSATTLIYDLVSIGSVNTYDLTGVTSAVVGAPGAGTEIAKGPIEITSSGSPEGVVAAPVGSYFYRTDGTENNAAYVKMSGTGNTGWMSLIGRNETTGRITLTPTGTGWGQVDSTWFVTGSDNPTSGSGLLLEFGGGTSFVASWNATGSSFLPLELRGSSIALTQGDVSMDGNVWQKSGQRWKRTAQGGDYPLTSGDFAVIFTATANATLPDASDAGAGKAFYVLGTGGAIVTVLRTGADTVEGAASYAHPANGGGLWISDGVSNWSLMTDRLGSSNDSVFLRGDQTWANNVSGNFGIGTSTWGTSAAKVLAMGAGTAPTTSPADVAQMWVGDWEATGGKATLQLRTEEGHVLQFGSTIHLLGNNNSTGLRMVTKPASGDTVNLSGLGNVSFYGWVSGANVDGASITAQAIQDWTASVKGTALTFSHAPKDDNFNRGTMILAGGALHLINPGSDSTTTFTDGVRLYVRDRAAAAGKGSLLIRAEDGTAHILGDRVGFGTVTPAYAMEVSGTAGVSGYLSVNGGQGEVGATVNLVADNTVILPAYNIVVVSSDNGTPANRTFLMGAPTGTGPYHLIKIIWTGANAGELIDDSTTSGHAVRLNGDWTPTAFDTLTLIYDQIDWVELGRSAN